jgi:RNA polymerase sigma-70 factor (ECF subfamily)
MFIDPEMLSRLQSRMMSVAYRMLGSVADAEDAVQDAFVRFREAGGVSSPERFLVRGRDRAARFLAGVFSKKYGALEMHAVRVNGAPGVVFTSGGAAVQVVALCIVGGVRAVYMTNNPDKLARWSVAEVE